MSLSRKQVYAEIKKILDANPAPKMEVGHYICSINECHQRAPISVSTFLAIATLCFDCMLKHGAVYRSLEPDPYKKFKRIHSFDSACNIVDSERRYQDQHWSGDSHSVEAYHTIFQHYLTKTIKAWTVNDGDTYALDFIRKLAAISVHCLEENG